MKEYVWLIKYQWDDEISGSIEGVFKNFWKAMGSLENRIDYMGLKGYWLLSEDKATFINIDTGVSGPFYLLRFEVF